MRKVYAECKDIPQEKLASIDTILEEASLKDYELKNELYNLVSKIQDNISAKVRWMLKGNN